MVLPLGGGGGGGGAYITFKFIRESFFFFKNSSLGNAGFGQKMTVKTRKTLNCPAMGCTNAECTGDYGMLSRHVCLEGILHIKIIRSPFSILFLIYEKGQAPCK